MKDLSFHCRPPTIDGQCCPTMAAPSSSSVISYRPVLFIFPIIFFLLNVSTTWFPTSRIQFSTSWVYIIIRWGDWEFQYVSFIYRTFNTRLLYKTALTLLFGFDLGQLLAIRAHSSGIVFDYWAGIMIFFFDLWFMITMLASLICLESQALGYWVVLD